MTSSVLWILVALATASSIMRHKATGFEIFKEGGIHSYHFESQQSLVADVNATENSQWSIAGELYIKTDASCRMKFQLKLSENGSPALESLSVPFSADLDENQEIHHLNLSASDLLWSANIKRAVVSLFQVKGLKPGAFVAHEVTIFGRCPVEYYVIAGGNANSVNVSKTYDMDRCSFPAGVYHRRSSIPINNCESHKPHAVSSRIASYQIVNSQLVRVDAQMRTNVQTSESYNPQFLYSNIVIAFRETLSSSDSLSFDIPDETQKSLVFESPQREATGGRSPKSSESLVRQTFEMLNKLADNLDARKVDMEQPFDETTSELIRLLSTMSLEALKMLFKEIDLGTSYRQETIRNLFFELIPRCGTPSSVLLTKDLIVEQRVKPTTALTMLIALPFNLAETSHELIKSCEIFLDLTPDRPDVRHAAILSFATMIYKAYTQTAISDEVFEKYIKLYFDRFLNSFEYEHQMLYLESLRNLQLGNVVNYLEPIITGNYSQTTDLRFLAMCASMPTAHMRPEKIFEIYWPIFSSRSTPIQLRIASFVLLLISNPTPGRMLALYNVVNQANDPQLTNFYRTTVLSLSESSHPCYRSLRRILYHMLRNLPEKPEQKYWSTANYFFDYRDRKYYIGALLQLMLIGGQQTDLPEIFYFKFDTYALGRFTGELSMHVKARGLTDSVIKRFYKVSSETLNVPKLQDVLQKMKLPAVSDVPLHLEIIFRIEDKSVLAFHLNQAGFKNLTDGDILNRVNALLMTDTHINMQTILRPFMIQYLLPTLIGTPVDILIESTMLATLRGNITQHFEVEKVNRNSQFDLRYSSYGVTKIRSYNPIQDVEYATVREQALLIYIPIFNELELNLLNKTFSFSFKRPASTASGISLKSRTRNTPLTLYLPPHLLNSKKLKFFHVPIDDLGVEVHLSVQQRYAEENVLFMSEADVVGNARVLEKPPFSAINQMVARAGLFQLNTIQIGQDKHLTLLVQNENSTAIDGTVKWDIEEFDKDSKTREEKIIRLEMSLSHRENPNDVLPLHKWDFVSKYSTFKNTKQRKLVLSVSRKHLLGGKWKMCTSIIVEPFVFLRRPFTITNNIVFGNYTTPRKCPSDKSRVDFNLTFGLPPETENNFESLIVDDNRCPKDVIRFTPPAYHAKCQKENFRNFTTLGQLDLRVKFENMPPEFENVANRVDHFLTALLPGNFQRLNLSESLRFSLRQDSSAVLNGIHFTMPVGFAFEWKSEGLEQFGVDLGFLSFCSLIRNDLGTFHGGFAKLEDKNTAKYELDNSSVLLAAECSTHPTFAVFVSFLKRDPRVFDTVTVFVGSHEILIHSNYQTEEGGSHIEINKERVFVSPGNALTFPADDKFFDYKMSVNDEGLLVIENELASVTIQYDLKNILSVRIPTIYRRKVCGLCNSRKI